MNLFNLFNRQTKRSLKDFSVLGTDVHAHLIPGVDDGPKTMEEALRLIKGLHRLGYQKLIATPHVMAGTYPNTKQRILSGLAGLRRAVNKAGIPVIVEAAAEYMLDEQFAELIDAPEPLLTLDGRHVLVEMGFIAAPSHLYDLLFRLQTQGYTPVMAHPERYSFLKGSLEAYHELKERGCRLQLNLLSLAGYYGLEARKTGEKLLQNDLIDFLGTDLHHEHHLHALKTNLPTNLLQRILRKKTFMNHTLVIEQ